MIQPFSALLPELQPAEWNRLDGAGEVERALAIARATAVDHETVVASVREPAEGALRALAFATLFERARERVMTIARGIGLPQTILTVRPDDGEAARAILVEIIGFARSAGVRTLFLGHTAAANVAVLRAASELGFRLLARDAYQLEVAGGTSFEPALAALPRFGRQCLRRDLRRLEASGATMAESPPSPEVVDQAWPMCLDLFRKYGSPLGYRRNLIAEMVRCLPPENLCFATCRREGELVGVALGTRQGSRATISLLLHAADPTVNLYAGMAAWWLRAEIERGSRVLFYSLYNDHYKRRLGCKAVPHQYGLLRL